MPTAPWATYQPGDNITGEDITSVELVPVSNNQWLEKLFVGERMIHQVVQTMPLKPKQYLPASCEAEMRVVIPYAPHTPRGDGGQYERHPATEAGAPQGTEWIDVSGSDWNYWSLLTALWSPDHSLMLIEHDVACRPDIYEAYRDSTEMWDMTNYDCWPEEDAAQWHWGILGCTRFSKQLMAKYPRLILDIRPGERHWGWLSTAIGKELRKLGYAPKEHFPRVNHHGFIGRKSLAETSA